MNLWQAIQQVRYLLRQAAWTDAPAERVFRSASVVISNSAVRESLLQRLVFPAAVVSDGGAQAHDEHPLVRTATIAVTVLAREEGDPWGADALLGAHRATTTGGSQHRGLLEVYRPILADVAAAGRESGLSVYFAGESDSAPVRVGQSLTLLAKEFRFEVLVHDAEAGEYPPVSGLTVTSAGGGVTVAWTRAALRWDLLSGAASVVRKQNSAPASAGDGTTIADGTTAASVANSPGAGTWHYGVLHKFAESTGTRYSSTIRTASIVIP